MNFNQSHTTTESKTHRYNRMAIVILLRCLVYSSECPSFQGDPPVVVIMVLRFSVGYFFFFFFFFFFCCLLHLKYVYIYLVKVTEWPPVGK